MLSRTSDITLADAIPPHRRGPRPPPLRLPRRYRPDVPGRATEELDAIWRLIVFVFLPFAAGFYLSYLFRTINALISGQLTSDLALGAADLGLLTSVYFLTFGAAQIPIGVVVGSLWPAPSPERPAAGRRRRRGALRHIGGIFDARARSRADRPWGRGSADGRPEGHRSVVSKGTRRAANGYMVMFGALGAVTATAPAELLLACDRLERTVRASRRGDCRDPPS